MSAITMMAHSLTARPRSARARRNGLNSSGTQGRTRTTLVRAAEPEFDEGAAQVRRLLDRDRKDMDFDALESAFDSGSPPTPTDASDSATAASPPAAPPAASSTPPASPAVSMSSKPTVSPFGSAGTPLPFEPKATKPSIEPRNLSPDMQPDRIEETPWWTKITLTQVVIVLSFTTIIGLMIATFSVVWEMGAIRLNE